MPDVEKDGDDYAGHADHDAYLVDQALLTVKTKLRTIEDKLIKSTFKYFFVNKPQSPTLF